MCGINGFNWQDQGLIRQMNKAIEHRGKDDVGVFISEKISLGHQRLSILDVSSKGHQPMNFEEFTIVFNGEIYNYQEIKKELEEMGYSFTSGTDTEVLLKSFHAWGSECLAKCNGMFAFAVWNEQKGELFLARDRIGIKPLFYYHKGDQFIFSSEIKAILRADIDRSIVPERISFIYKMSCLPDDLTMFKHIKQLPAGHCAIVRKDSCSLHQYWKIHDYRDIADYEYLKKEIRNIITDSVRLRLISDVPLGVFLSGGIDSSIIAALAGTLSNTKLKTFSIGFATDQEEEKYNADFYLARKTAHFFGTDHHELFLQKGRALEYLSNYFVALDMPNGMTTAVPSFWLSQWAKQYVSVVLGGDGGDELFGGYPRYQLSLAATQWQRLPKFFRSVVPYSLLERITHKSDLQKRLNIQLWSDRYMDLKMHADEDAPRIFKNNIYQPETVRSYVARQYFANIPSEVDFEKYFMDVDRRTWLVDHSLIRTDATTMQFALEERVPMLDYRLVELANRIPTQYKVSRSDTKIILKETFKADLPEFLFNQPKRGWLSPAAKWLRTELKDFAYDVFSDSYVPESQNYFDLKLARELLDKHIGGERYNLHLLWILITWQLWYKKTFMK